MKHTPNQLFEQLSKEFTSKKEKEVINEELGQIVTLKPLVQMESSIKEPFWTKFENFLAEGGTLDPLVNNEDKVKYNSKEQDEKIKADPKLKFEMDNKLGGSYKVSDAVENINSHNYDYDPKVENINNVNAQEVLSGVQLEINYNKELSLDEAMELAVKNLAKDPLHYVKEGQFGVQGLGYKEGKQQQNDGESYGGSGFSTKLKDGGDSMELVKESKELVLEAFGQVVSSGNPNSLAAQSGNLIRQMMAEKEEETKLPMDEMEDEGTAVSYSDTTSEAAKPDFMDIDGDGDKEESMKKAGKDMKARKPKKETIDTKLAEIGKEAEKVKMEAQLDYLHDHIQEKADRISSIQEDENLSELIDKTKMKQMQREIKDLERKKMKMERIYEKSCGSKYAKKEMVGEMDAVSWNDKNNPTRGAAGERDPKKVGKSTSAYAINEVLFKMDNNKAKEYYKPLADVIKSMGYETNLKAENPGSTQSIDSLPQAFLYYNTELPTEEEGVHKGKDVSLTSLKGGPNSVNKFMSDVDPHPEDTKKEYDFTVNGGEYYAKSQDVLKRLENAMGDSVDADPIKKLTSTFTSNKDFKPVTYYKMIMFPKKQ